MNRFGIPENDFLGYFKYLLPIRTWPAQGQNSVFIHGRNGIRGAYQTGPVRVVFYASPVTQLYSTRSLAYCPTEFSKMCFLDNFKHSEAEVKN